MPSEVYDHFEGRRQLDGHGCRIDAFQDPVDVAGEVAIGRPHVRTVGDKTSGIGIDIPAGNGGQFVLERKPCDALPPQVGDSVGKHHQRIGASGLR